MAPSKRNVSPQDTSDPRHFGTSAEDTPMPNCPDISTLVPKLTVTDTERQFGTGQGRLCLRNYVN